MLHVFLNHVFFIWKMNYLFNFSFAQIFIDRDCFSAEYDTFSNYSIELPQPCYWLNITYESLFSIHLNGLLCLIHSSHVIAKKLLLCKYFTSCLSMEWTLLDSWQFVFDCWKIQIEWTRKRTNDNGAIYRISEMS